MATHADAAGTLVGRYEGRAPGAPALLLGSHIDTVRDAGPFDGGAGVLIVIAVVARMNRVAKRFAFAIEVIAFGDGDGEGVRFASTLGGSRALAGILNPKSLDERDSEGVTRREALVAFGCDPERIGEAAGAADDALGYVEVHIEQGPVLEAADAPLGLVTAICGASRGAVRVKGESGHDGGMPMAMRRDALAGSAEMLLAIERRAAAEPHLVATVERLEVSNADVNTIPGEVNFTIDVRAPSELLAQGCARCGCIRRADRCLRRVACRRTGGRRRAPRLPDAAAFKRPRPRRHFIQQAHSLRNVVRALPGLGQPQPHRYASPDDLGAAADVLADFAEHFVPLRLPNVRRED